MAGAGLRGVGGGGLGAACREVGRSGVPPRDVVDVTVVIVVAEVMSSIRSDLVTGALSCRKVSTRDVW